MPSGRPLADPAAGSAPLSDAAPPRSPLGRRLLVNFAVVGALATALIFAVLTGMIRSSFGQLEQAEIDRQIGRAQAYLAENRDQQGLRSKDWGYWDEAYVYLERFEPGFEARNVTAESFRNAIIDGMHATQAQGRGERTFYIDPQSEETDLERSAQLRAIAHGPAYRAALAKKGEIQGYVAIGGELHSIAGIAVLKSDLTGPSNGTMSFVKRVEPAEVNKALQLETRIDLRAVGPTTSVEKLDDRINVALPVEGIDGKPVAMLRFTMPRSAMAAGTTLRNLALGSLGALIATMIWLLNRRVRSLVVDPVRRLRDHVVAIRSSGELSALAGEAPANEIGEMQDEFNAMAGELNTLRAEFERQSFALGRSEAAVGAMHNVRNALAPVNVILGTLEQAAARTVPPNARRALDELADPATPDERRQGLTAYLGTLLGEFDADRETARGHAREAGRHLASALETISERQSGGGAPDFDESCDLGGLVGRAASAARFAPGLDIAIAIDCPDRIVARGNRVLLTQIVENLVANALEAIAARGTGAGRIAVAVRSEADRQSCSIAITDDGDGFDPALAPRLFEPGYSTRKGKSGGL